MKVKISFPKKEIKSAKELKVEELSTNSPIPDSATPSIGALMVKKMIEVYERRNAK